VLPSLANSLQQPGLALRWAERI